MRRSRARWRSRTRSPRQFARRWRQKAAACSPSSPASARSSAPQNGWEGRVGIDVDIMPLYGNLDGKAQDAAIRPAPEGRRKVVLATAIAETSITIDGVRVVVDCGLSRLPKYEPATGITRLETRARVACVRRPAGRARRPHAARAWRSGCGAPSRPRRCPPSRRRKSSRPTCPACCSTAPRSALPIRRALSFLDPPPLTGAQRGAYAVAGARRDRRRGTHHRRRTGDAAAGPAGAAGAYGQRSRDVRPGALRRRCWLC